MVTSFSHLFADLAIIAAFGYAASHIPSLPIPFAARLLLWAVYWYAQGAVMTGVWVIARKLGRASLGKQPGDHHFEKY